MDTENASQPSQSTAQQSTAPQSVAPQSAAPQSTAQQPAALRIRPPRPEDFPRIAELAAELGYPSTAAQIASRLQPMLSSPDHAVFVAEFPNGEVAGWIGLYVNRTVESDPRVEIGGLVVAASSRSQGVGAQLLARAEDWARQSGCAAISLRSNVLRDRAHAFYLRHGYQLVKTQKSFRKNL